MKKAYNLNGSQSTRSMGESFLYGTFERQHSMLKKAGLPNNVRSVTDVDMVLIHRETDSKEVTHFKICDFADETLFTAMRVKVAVKPTSGISRRESFQYLVKRFERNDPLVVKPRYGSHTDTEIHCPGGRIWGRCSHRPELGDEVHEIRDLTDSSLFAITLPQAACGCVPLRKKRPKYQVKKRGDPTTVATFSKSKRDSPVVVTFPDNLECIYKLLFIGSAISVFSDPISASTDSLSADSKPGN